MISVYDSFVTQLQQEIFLCDTNLTKNMWLIDSSIKPASILERYKEAKFNSANTFSCNTDKSKEYTCALKCRTTGIQICATNCGIVINWKEMYMSELLTFVRYIINF